MSKRKKLNKISLAVSSLGLTLLLGASALAASSIARIDGSHLDVSGATIERTVPGTVRKSSIAEVTQTFHKENI